MPEQTRSNPAPLLADVRQTWSDVAEMLALRRRLAETELRSDLAASKQLAISAGVGLVVAVTGLPVLVIAIASFADRHFQLSFPWISTATGGVLLLGGSLFAWLAYTKFRRNFCGFQQSLAELQEDLIWLHEWAGNEAEVDDE